MTELEELGRTLKTARRKKNLTQQQLADLSHMSLKYLQLVEKGGKNPSFEILRALSGVLDLSLDALINPTMENDEKAANEMKQLYHINADGEVTFSIGFFLNLYHSVFLQIHSHFF